MGRVFRVGRDWEVCEGEGVGWEFGVMVVYRGMLGLALGVFVLVSSVGVVGIFFGSVFIFLYYIF